jgi:hypothetical protein
MSVRYPWFRFYSEALNDPKIKRVCRVTKLPKAVVMGTWVILLTMANDSPARGRLMVTEDIPYSIDEILDELGVDDPLIIKALDEIGLIHWNTDDDCLVITAWDNRQFESDNSAERTRKYRQRKKEQKLNECVTVYETSQERHGDVTVTGKSKSNKKDTETEQEVEVDTKTQNAAADLVTFFSSQTNKSPRGVGDMANWQMQCETILEMSNNDPERAKALMSEAIIILEDKSYRYKSPGSLVATIEGQLKPRKRNYNGRNQSEQTRNPAEPKFADEYPELAAKFTPH